MPNTFELIASSTAGSGGVADFTFTSIPATYTDLCVKISLRSSISTNDAKIEFNGVSTNLSERAVGGNGSSTYSFNDSLINPLVNPSTFTSNTFTSSEFYIPNYAGSAYKSVNLDSVQETNATAANAILTAALWSNTAAITSIKIAPSSGNFVQYSTAYLYGVKNA